MILFLLLNFNDINESKKRFNKRFLLKNDEVKAIFSYFQIADVAFLLFKKRIKNKICLKF